MAGRRLTFLQAAEEVLRKHSPGAPLHFRRITELAFEEGFISSQGATPAQTMGAQLYTDVKRRIEAGRPERFRALGGGRFLLATAVDPLGGAIDRNNADVLQRLRAVLAEINPAVFEQLIATLLASIGFEAVEVTNYSGDGGIDVRATLTVGGVTDVRTAVQVKRWSNNVSGRTVRELRGGLGPHERGLIITLSDFTSDARKEASAPDRTPITLLNGDQLLELLVDNDIGVSRKQVQLLQLDEMTLLPADEETAEGPTNDGPVGGGLTSSYQGSRALSMWPLPGGKAAWRQTLEDILRHIAESAPSVQQTIDWILEHYERVNSAKVARGYLVSVLRPLGLIAMTGDQLVLTAVGAEYIEAPSADALIKIARANVAGFDEIVEELERAPRSTADLLAALRRILGVAWDTDAQVKFRLEWLETLGVVIATPSGWALRRAVM